MKLAAVLIALLQAGSSALFSQPAWMPSNILPASYIAPLDDFRMYYKEKEKTGLMDHAGKKITPADRKGWNSLDPGNLYGFQDTITGQWGLADMQGKALSGAIYTRVDPFKEGYGRVQRRAVSSTGVLSGYEYNLIDKTGKHVLPKFYKYLSDVSEGLLVFQGDSLTGFMTPQGQVVIKPAFSFAEGFQSGLAPVRNDQSQWGYIDKTGKLAIPFQFDVAEPFSGNTARVGKKGPSVSRSSGPVTSWGLIDTKGALITPMQYKMILNPDKQGLRIARNTSDQYLLLGAQGQVLTTKTYEDLSYWGDEAMIRFRTGKLYGYLNAQGKEAIPAQYEGAYMFSEGLAAVKKDGKYGFINTSGQVVIPFQFLEASEFRNGMCRVSREGELCVINKQGQVVKSTGLPYTGNSVMTKTTLFPFLKKTILLLDGKGNRVKLLPYDDVASFSEGLAAVKSGIKWGYMDAEGKVVVPLQWEAVNSFSEGVAAVQVNSSTMPHIIDKSGQKLFDIPFGTKYIGPFSEGLAKVAQNNLGGYMDKTGKMVIPAKYLNLGDFKNGMAIVVNTANRYGFVDKTGKEVITPTYDGAGNFSAEGLAPVKQGNLWGFVDRTGKAVIPPQFEAVSGFNNGVSAVKKGGKVGYIDAQNTEVVPLMFEDGKEFLDDYAAVKQNGKWGFANLKGRGKLVIPAQYENVGKYAENLVFVRLNGKAGAISRSGATVVPFLYDDAGEFSGGIAYVKKNNKFGIVDNTGKEIIPPICDLIGNYHNGRIVVVLDLKGYAVF